MINDVDADEAMADTCSAFGPLLSFPDMSKLIDFIVRKALQR
jgi:hypothetical protein